MATTAIPFTWSAEDPDDSGPLYFVRLQTFWEFQYFSRKYRLISGNDVSIDFLQKAHVVGCFIGPRMIGGYSLNWAQRQKIRAIEVIPDGLQTDVLNDFDLSLNQLLEVGTLWLDSTSLFETGRMDRNPIPYITVRIKLYLNLFHNVTRLAERFELTHVVAGSFEKGLRGWQRIVLNKTLYKGVAKGDQRLIELYFATISRFKRSAMLALLFRLFRTGKSRQPKISTH